MCILTAFEPPPTVPPLALHCPVLVCRSDPILNSVHLPFFQQPAVFTWPRALYTLPTLCYGLGPGLGKEVVGLQVEYSMSQLLANGRSYRASQPGLPPQAKGRTGAMLRYSMPPARWPEASSSPSYAARCTSLLWGHR